MPVKAGTVASTYKASVISVDYPSALAPGAVGELRVQLKNIGSAPWLKNGKSFVSLYRWDPRTKQELPSAFARSSWETTKRPARIPAARVNSGETVAIAFPLSAPKKPGVYREEFVLCAEGTAWVAHSPFVIEVRVGAAGTVVGTSVSQSATTIVASPAVALSQEWQSQLVSQGGTQWQLEPGQTTNVQFVFRNTGTKIWKREGAGYVSLYAVDGNKERVSSFAPASGWISGSHVVKMQESQVGPGQNATFSFTIRGPRTPNAYQEAFALAAEDVTWIPGAIVTIPITLPITNAFIATAPAGTDLQSPVTAPPTTIGKYTTSLLLRSVQAIKAVGSSRAEMTLGFKNIGTEAWKSRSIRFVSIQGSDNGQTPSLRDQSWNDTAEAIRLLGSTKSGEIAFASFSMRVPSSQGTYKASFQLYADDQPVDGGMIDIPITVTNDTPLAKPSPLPTPVVSAPVTTIPVAPTNSSQPALNPVPLNGDSSSLPPEPKIRVGIFATTDDQMQVRVMNVPLVVQQNGTTICRIIAGDLVTIRYDRINKVYTVQGGACSAQSSTWYVVRAEDGIAPMEVADFSRPLSWLPGANDNKFRAQLELRYTPATNAVWMINELPMEYYLKGIAETSNSSPQEFQRTLLTAARTYAMYHVQRGTKHANEFYIVDATLDQVYRGFGSEARSPNIAAAVDATRSQVVTYNGNLAITPYFSRSDGRTRSWGEVWYGGSQYPWLIGVPVPEDQGRTLWGHGVGMSASGALSMANAGQTYDRILKHFYTGIELRRAYQ